MLGCVSVLGVSVLGVCRLGVSFYFVDAKHRIGGLELPNVHVVKDDFLDH